MHENPASHPGSRRHTPRTARAHPRTTLRQHLRPSPADTTALVTVTLAGQRQAGAIQAGPMKMRSEEVSFYSGGCTIAGTFTEAADPVAAALRYDKRGVGASGGDYLRAGMDDRRADARAALGWLAAKTGGLPLLAVGHSEGAWYAAELAAGDAVAGAVLLGGGARPAEEILSWQTEMLAARLPGTARMILKITRTDIIRTQRKRVARIKASTDDVIRLQGIRFNARWWRDFTSWITRHWTVSPGPAAQNRQPPDRADHV